MAHLPLRIMEVCLAIGLLLTTFIIVQTAGSRTQLASWNPNTISGIAAIVANSRDLAHSFAGSSAEPLNALRNCLTGRQYDSRHTTKGLSVETLDEDQGEAMDSVRVPETVALLRNRSLFQPGLSYRHIPCRHIDHRGI